MSETGKKVIPRLIELSTIDASLARLLAERRSFEKKMQDASVVLDKIKSEHQKRTLELKEKRQSASKEEKYIKGERDKLVARRKSMATMGDYKIQQAAEREIDATETQLEKREEELLGIMMQADEIENALKELAAKLEAAQKEFEGYQSESEPFLKNLEERTKEKSIQRSEITSDLDSATLRKYESVLKRSPTDPLSAVKGNLCGVCSMSLGAQLIVKISRGETLEQCPGCHRIVHLAQTQSE